MRGARPVFWMLSLAAAACSREGAGADGGGTEAGAGAPRDAMAIADAAADRDAPRDTIPTRDSRAPPGEARRRTVKDIEKDDALKGHATLVRERFGEASKAPLLVQETDLAGGRRGWLLSTPDLESHQVIVEEQGRVAFSKQRPTAGLLPPVRLLALSPRPDGGAVLFSYVPAARAIAARMWTSDGGSFAEILVMTLDACDALRSSYEEGVGWTVRAITKNQQRIQLLREDGTLAWGKDGVELPLPR